MKSLPKFKDTRWTEVFSDCCTRDWRDHWTLDGHKANITNDTKGMDFAAGPVFGDDSCHAVLWTKKVFHGDIRIDFEYTKLDDTIRAVTILYILATGTGVDPYHADIGKWHQLREYPSMSTYYDNMNLYHITYAAYELDNTDPASDYIRARRYLPAAQQGLKGTAFEPDYLCTGLFEKDVPHRITVARMGDDFTMDIRCEEKSLSCRWKTDVFPPISEGRIGLRHMYTRRARYRDFRVSVPEKSINGG